MSKRSNVGAIIGGTVAAAGVVGILVWWGWVYMKENPSYGNGKKEPGTVPRPSGPPRSMLQATVVEDEGTADQLAAEQAPEPHVPENGGVPTISLGGS